MRLHTLPMGTGLIFLLSTNVFITIEAAIKRGREGRTWWIFDKHRAQCVSKVSSRFSPAELVSLVLLQVLSGDLCLRWKDGFAFMYRDGRWCKILHHVDRQTRQKSFVFSFLTHRPTCILCCPVLIYWFSQAKQSVSYAQRVHCTCSSGT